MVYGKKSFICPRCKNLFEGYPAISRRDNKTEICSSCGEVETMFDFEFAKMREPEKRWLNEKK